MTHNKPGNGGAGSNTPAGGGGAAGAAAIDVSGSGSVYIVNITSTDNLVGTPGTGTPAGGPSACTDLAAFNVPEGGVTVRNAILWEGTMPVVPVFGGNADIARCIITAVSGSGNILGAPTFVNSGAGDYSLAGGSRGIDAGDNTANGIASPDLAGNNRYHNDAGVADTGVSGGAGGASVVDIGAYEFQGTSPHCAADFDNSGGLEVADIFAFLNAWFSGDPSADVNGGGLSVQDVFDYLNLWFAGC
jgi:hypothetical protein